MTFAIIRLFLGGIVQKLVQCLGSGAPGEDVQTLLGRKVGIARFDLSREQSEQMFRTAPLYGGPPLNAVTAFDTGDASVAASRVLSVIDDRIVPVVLRLGAVSQIAPAVVRTITVDVVNRMVGGLASHHHKRQAVREATMPRNADAYVAIHCGGPSDLANLGRAAKPDFPREKAGFWIVIEKLTGDLRRRQSGSVHARLSGGKLLKSPEQMVILCC